ncbi:chemotaxis protein CheB [Mesorhizobium sp.]|uniref:chemotaxis protein CheB n=1 Tax=Mesorhizobium sp. TaxID=1871066 RepID=UPI00338FE09F
MSNVGHRSGQASNDQGRISELPERIERMSSRNRCIIVVGASAGGVEALKRLATYLPPDLAAAVFVVLHVGQTSYLPEILDRAGPLRAIKAKSGEQFERGRIYVASPGFHLLLHHDHMLLRRGPRENLARPAIDPLFRSAACSYGARVIGVLLSGSLSDGTSGLRAIKTVGGVTVIQDPQDAAVPDMVRSAQRHVEIDHCVPIVGMGDLLARLASEPAGETLPVPPGVRLEAAVAAQEHSAMSNEDRLGELSLFVCPECHGPLWEIEDGDMLRYRCHTGHAFTSDAMLEAQSAETDQILWSLLRAHQQRAAFTRRMADRESELARVDMAAKLQERSREHEADAEVIERILESRRGIVAENGATTKQN